MTINQAVLSVLSETETMCSDDVLFEIPTRATPREVTDCLDSLTKSGEVVHSMIRSSSHYRKRSSRELGEYLAVKAGTQRELL